MQFQVPQFIETEDKIIGPFTLKQFLYVGVAGLISFFLYFTVSTGIWIVCSVVVVGAGLGLALGQYNGLPIPTVLMNAAFFYWNEHLYLWQPNDRDAVPKNPSTVKQFMGEGVDLEKIMSGIALKTAYQYVQTGSPATKKEMTAAARQKESVETYRIFRKITGDRQAAKRIDYR